MKVKIKKLHPDAIAPTYATDGSGCFDLYAIKAGEVDEHGWNGTFDTGLAFEIPQGHAMLIFSRSGHGFKDNVRLANCVGVIDSDYRGSVQVKLTADEGGYLWVNAGDRIAQAMIIPVPRVEFVEADELSDTSRGTGGFGSTGQ